MALPENPHNFLRRIVTAVTALVCVVVLAVIIRVYLPLKDFAKIGNSNQLATPEEQTVPPATFSQAPAAAAPQKAANGNRKRQPVKPPVPPANTPISEIERAGGDGTAPR